MFFGSLLRVTGWNYAVMMITVAVGMLALFFNLLMDLKDEKPKKASVLHSRIHNSSQGSRIEVMSKQLGILLHNPDTWLIMGTMFGSFFVWSFGDYQAVFA